MQISSAVATGNLIQGKFGSPEVLKADQLGFIVDAAIARMSPGLSTEQRAALTAVQFTVDNLPGAILGQSTGRQIVLDANAAGYGCLGQALLMQGFSGIQKILVKTLL